MTERPTSTTWRWTRTALAGAVLVALAWAWLRFDVSEAWRAALGGASIAVLLHTLATVRGRDEARGQGVLILGSSPIAAKLIDEMDSAADGRFRLIGVIDDAEDAARTPGVTPILGRLDAFAQAVTATRPGRIVLAMADRRGRVPERTLLESRFNGILVEEAVDFFERVSGKLAIEAMRPSSLIMSAGFGQSELARSIWMRRLRGGGCRLGAGLALVLASPLLILAAVVIKLDSAGPVFFVQERIGLGGRAFRLFKFRTMREGTTSRKSEWVSDNANRITRVGRWLRRFRLDELPQLINVVRGEMNVVGPRPHPVSNYELFLRYIPYYEFRSLVRPGITGWAQVRYGYANGLEEETEKMRYDFYYIKHRSLRLDCRIILETLGVLLFDRRSHQAAKTRVAADELPGLNVAS